MIRVHVGNHYQLYIFYLHFHVHEQLQGVFRAVVQYELVVRHFKKHSGRRQKLLRIAGQRTDETNPHLEWE